MADRVKGGKWAAGAAYGPVLSQTDLYLLNADLEINPVLAGTSSDFTLMFDIVRGEMGGYNPDAQGRHLQFTGKDEPATFPRVNQVYIITKWSPWVTVVRNDRGVTCNDVLTTFWRDYNENEITEPELSSLNGRVQEHIRRTAQSNQAALTGVQNWGYYTPAQAARPKRVDWLRDHIQYDRLVKEEKYAKDRLGFVAQNIFIMLITS